MPPQLKQSHEEIAASPQQPTMTAADDDLEAGGGTDTGTDIAGTTAVENDQKPHRRRSRKEVSFAPILKEDGTLKYAFQQQQQRNNNSSSDDDIPTVVETASWPPTRWEHERKIRAILGCVSATTVLIVRLILDSEPTAYVIHSIIVFFDMILIHIFTNSKWLSISGECLAISMMFAFHFTGETLWELLETTLIAVLCSFHLIASRSEAFTQNTVLQQEFQDFRRDSCALMLQKLDEHHHTKNDDEDNTSSSSMTLLQHRSTSSSSSSSSESSSLRRKISDWFVPPSDPVCQERARICGSHFFEHFLDGSAGVYVFSFIQYRFKYLCLFGGLFLFAS